MRDHDPPDGERIPAKLHAYDVGDESHLPGKGKQHRLQVREPRLDFDDQERPRGGVPGQDVDGTPITEYVESKFELEAPTGPPKDADDEIDQGGMGCIDEAIAQASSKPDIKEQNASERRDDPIQRTDGHACQLASFDARVDGLADARLVGDRLLGQSLMQTDGA
jgi:hypothetical protein